MPQKANSEVHHLIPKLSPIHKDDLKQEIDFYFKTQKVQWIPSAIQLLNHIENLPGRTDTLVVAKLFDTAQSLLQKAIRPAIIPTSEILCDLNSIEKKSLQEGLQTWNQDWRKFYALDSFDLWKKIRLWQTVQRAEDWVGDLDNFQKKKIRDLLEGVPAMEYWRTRRRIRLQDSLLFLLQKEDSSKKECTQSVQKLLVHWHLQPQKTLTPKEREVQKLWKHGMVRLFVVFWNDLKRTKKMQAKEKIRKWIQVLKTDLNR